ncbi:MAG: MogA/MoaB family molybdenum cofactor biosynthesis protein [Haloarculaceae archaeon]
MTPDHDSDGGHESHSHGEGGGHDRSHDHGDSDGHGHDHGGSGGHDHGHDSHDHSHEHDHDDHHHHDVETVGLAVLTVSSSRTLAEDPSGDAIESLVGDSEVAELVARDLVGDSRDAIGEAVDGFLEREDTDAVVTTGGTGITPDDVTIETVSERFEKELPGFGELFRRRSEAEIGTMVVGTRATAGVVDGTVVFSLPGSENAARLGTRELILPEVGHLAGLAGR